MYNIYTINMFSISIILKINQYHISAYTFLHVYHISATETWGDFWKNPKYGFNRWVLTNIIVVLDFFEILVHTEYKRLHSVYISLCYKLGQVVI